MKKHRFLSTVLTFALLSGMTPPSANAARNDDGRSTDSTCSNRTLRGNYAFHIEGAFVDAPTPLWLRGVAMTTFDGRGHLTQVDHVVFAGAVPPVDWTPATGTYRIKADCTGEAEIIIPGSPFSPVILRLVVGADGRRIETVVSKAGYVVSSSAVKVDSSR